MQHGVNVVVLMTLDEASMWDWGIMLLVHRLLSDVNSDNSFSWDL